MIINKERNPSKPIPVSLINWNKINNEKDNLTWFGHSAYLLNIDNKKILLDPMLGPNASPVSFVGVRRYKYSKDILSDVFDEMPPIDAVFISHDHYDHLDYYSIMKLESKVQQFFVPHGVGTYLKRWGISKEKITEFNLWDEIEYHGLTLVFTPSNHFSGRMLIDNKRTLWGGWIIIGKNTRLYTSGDGGYGDNFKEIGKKYGPFDITLMEGGQYDKFWTKIHMTPEQSVKANLDVNGKNMILMHWGAFSLANHGWNEPIQRAIKEAKKENVNLIFSKIGETIILDSDMYNFSSPWWDF